MNVPNGYDELIARFGDITKYIRGDGELDLTWEDLNIQPISLPFPMKLAWNLEIEVTRMRCHRLLGGTFQQAFTQIAANGLIGSIQGFGGCYQYRPQRASQKLSTHSWGIAIDLNPQTNEMGTDGNQDPALVEVFTDLGFIWGGTFAGARKDPMHFQYVSGY